jgi:F-type H+-transporting ATPase subunit gamma
LVCLRSVKSTCIKSNAASSVSFGLTLRPSIRSILEKAESLDHPYLVDNGSPKNAVIVISGNRGLAGGYNNNIVKEVMEQGLTPDNTVIYGVGKKGVEFLRRRGYEIVSETNDMIDEPKFEDAAFLGKTLLEAYEKGEIGKIYIAYTRFKNTVVHIPTVMQLLPVEVTAEQKAEGTSEAPMNFEPEPEAALELIVPKYINSLIYGAFVESVASENGARMQAMDSATSNADEIIATLSLAYNRARQGAITQELTEIISGAEALG